MTDTIFPSRRTIQLLSPVLLVLLLTAGCQRHEAAGPAAESDKQPPPVSSVTTTRPVKKTFVYKIEQPGEIEAYMQTPIYSFLSGYVESVAKDIGDRVAEGEVLAVLSVPEMVEEHKEKKALVAQADVEVELAKKLEAGAAKNVEYMDAKIAEATAARPRGVAELGRAESQYQRLRQLSTISADAV